MIFAMASNQDYCKRTTISLEHNVDTDSVVGSEWDQDKNPDEESVENIKCIEKWLFQHASWIFRGQLFATEYF